MPDDETILRIFEVEAKSGCSEKLLTKFETTSAAVVQDEPGNKGYFFGECVQGAENVVMFVSVWEDLAAVKARFGESWQESFIPDGYDALIEKCSLRHLRVGTGWHVANLARSV